MPTPNQLLLEHLFTGNLPAAVDRARKAGKSWRQIALEISDETGQPVSYESLRTWYGEHRAGAA